MTTVTQTLETRPVPLFQLRDFRFVWAGLLFVSLAVQAFSVGLVWLVLELTGSGTSLGIVLTVAAVPRALLMIISGTLIDRSSPRTILLWSSLIRAGTTGLIALLLGGDGLALAHVFLFAGIMGMMDAFYYPLTVALPPRLVHPSQLAAANATLQTTDTLANIGGPLLGGLVIGEMGLEIAFVVITALFLLGSAMTLWLRGRSLTTAALTQHDENTPKETFWHTLKAGFRYAWNNQAVRISLLLIAMLNFAALGPAIVGTSIMVEQRFGGDASLYGILSAAYGGGALLGGILAGVCAQWVRRPGLLLVYIAFVLGALQAVFGFSPDPIFALVINAIMGVTVGLVSVYAITWLQNHSSAEMQGRLAGLIVFASVALDPLSQGISGFVSDIDLTLLFVASGVIMILTSAVVYRAKAIRQETKPAS
jgi:MFS family permease